MNGFERAQPSLTTSKNMNFNAALFEKRSQGRYLSFCAPNEREIVLRNHRDANGCWREGTSAKRLFASGMFIVQPKTHDEMGYGHIMDQESR